MNIFKKVKFSCMYGYICTFNFWSNESPTMKIGMKIIMRLVSICAKNEKIEDDVFLCYSKSKAKVQ